MECNLSIYINYSCLPQFYTAWKPSKETIKKVKGNKGKERDKEKDKKKRKAVTLYEQRIHKPSSMHNMS